jgi:hypothetical protein
MKKLRLLLPLFLIPFLISTHLFGQATKQGFETITTPILVDSARKAILQLQAERSKLQHQNLPSLALRYKNNEPNALDSILLILHSNDVASKKQLLVDLNFLEEENLEGKLCHEPTLSKAILSLMSDTLLLPELVQLAGYMRIPGYGEAFEKNILSGKTQQLGRQFFWLGYEGTRLAPISFLGSKIITKEIEPFTEYWVFLGFSNYASQGNAHAKEAVFNWCWKIYDKQILPQDWYLELKHVYASTNPAAAITDVLLSLGDERIIPFAHWCLEKDIFRAKALEALARLSDPKIEVEIVKLLKSKTAYFDGLDAAVSHSLVQKDNSLNTAILSNFEKHKFKDGYEIQSLAEAILKLKQGGISINLQQGLKSTTLKAKLNKVIEIESISMAQLAADLYKSGLIKNPMSTEELNLLKLKTTEAASFGKILALFDDRSMLYRFNLEPGFIPVSYESLLKDIFRLSIEKIKVEAIYQANLESDSSLANNYNITLIANDKVYLFIPEDLGSNYDLNALLNLLGKVCEDANIEERFLNLDAGQKTAQLVFADPKKLQQFLSNFQLLD